MKKIYDTERIAEQIHACPYCDLFASLDLPVFVVEYETGEFISTPWSEQSLFQIICQGTLSIYYVRDDGSRYSLAEGGTAYCLGESAIFETTPAPVYAQATTGVVCLAFSVTGNEEKLLKNNLFLQLICRNMVAKLSTITVRDAAPSSLSERAWNFMKFKCENGLMKGLEKTAFQLHCSARQLQRVMNSFEEQGLVKKTGKGAYQLIDDKSCVNDSAIE
ncbi:MAG: cyclic nucleotide-binding domain-containing protein [Eubacteriales bacterium]|nr:cyclic nucleotide-binding domain-containing protein [Eubacteriales bacterium]